MSAPDGPLLTREGQGLWRERLWKPDLARKRPPYPAVIYFLLRADWPSRPLPSTWRSAAERGAGE
jgi:hypothetical protein